MIFSFAGMIDQADLWLFRTVPSRTKKIIFRKLIDAITPFLPKVIELNGRPFHVPPHLVSTYVLQNHETETQVAMKQYVRPGMIVVDVGANIGYHSIFLATLVGQNGRVYAIEPGRDNFAYLKKNVQFSTMENIKVFPCAAGVERRQREFHLHRRSTLHSFHASIGSYETVEVQEVLLDEVVNEPVDFVKIDVEGAEIEVLTGMNQMLRSNQEIQLLVEWNPGALASAGYSAKTLPEFLMTQGFELSLIEKKVKHSRKLDDIMELLHANRLSKSWHANIHAKRVT